MMEEHLELTLSRPGEPPYSVKVRKGEYEELGLLFETYLMDKQHSCRNKCIFCFVDQTPPGLRESLYFKDDDDRMSFLFGNYITLTNLQQKDIDRILQMHISPINISVHTTNPELRVKMMKNPQAGKVLEWIPALTGAGIKVNTQLVLCPGWNDGAELERSLRDLCALAPNLQSISVVPVGITKYREGLPDLRPFTKEEAAAVIETVGRFGSQMKRRFDSRTCYPADEFFLLADEPLPQDDYYDDYFQLENGVGLMTLLDYEFQQAIQLTDHHPVDRRVAIATGTAAAPLMKKLAQTAMEAFPGLRVTVLPIRNDFWGHSITVAGLVAGRDLTAQLADRNLGDQLLLPSVMLRRERDLFLDNTPLEDVEQSLGVPIRMVDNDGFVLLDALLGRTESETEL